MIKKEKIYICDSCGRKTLPLMYTTKEYWGGYSKTSTTLPGTWHNVLGKDLCEVCYKKYLALKRLVKEESNDRL